MHDVGPDSDVTLPGCYLTLRVRSVFGIKNSPDVTHYVAASTECHTPQILGSDTRAAAAGAGAAGAALSYFATGASGGSKVVSPVERLK